MICIHVSSQFLFFIYQTCKPEQPCDCGKRYIESKFSAKAKCYTRVVKDLKPLGLACLHEFDDRDYLDVGRPYVDDEAPMVEGAFITAFNSPDCGFYVFSDKDVDGFRKVQHKIPADGIVLSIETNIEPFVKGLLKASSSSFNGNVDNIFGSIKYIIFQTCSHDRPCDCGKEYIKKFKSARSKCYARVVAELEPMGLICAK